MRSRRPEIASPWRRAAAGGIDVLAVIAPASISLLAWSKLPSVTKRSGKEDRLLRPSARCAVGAGPRTRSSRSWWTISSAVSMGLGIGLRNWRTPGGRLLGIRRVDASTGGPISVRSVIVHQLVARLMTAPLMEIWRSGQQRRMYRMQELAPRLKDLQREHADDPDAMHGAVTQFYKENKVHPLRSCLGLPVVVLAANTPIFWSRSKQTLPERLAGIVVVKA